MENNTVRSIQRVIRSEDVQMGHLTIKQPIPVRGLKQVDPFILLHHLHLKDVTPGTDPLGIGPHPHRGFEPVTFIFDGEVAHRDSGGNEASIGAGGVQWMTAGQGIVHSEMAGQGFVEQGGAFQIIQLWINLPRRYKMVPPRYQDLRPADIPTVEEEKVQVRVVAGSYGSTTGPIKTYSPLTVMHVRMEAGGQVSLPLEVSYNACLYLMEGALDVNDTQAVQDTELVVLGNDGDGITLKADTASHFLVLAGAPINEPLVQYGPFVMNSQAEIMEAMRDYQEGKMGVVWCRVPGCGFLVVGFSFW